MKKTDLLYSFWAKAVAFVLAALLVPTLLAYGITALWQYSDESEDFFRSELCDGAVSYRPAYCAMEELCSGQQDITHCFPLSGSSNTRYVLRDSEGSVLYDNHRAGDVYLHDISGGADYGNGIAGRYTASLYVDPSLPVQDDIYWAKQAYDILQGMAAHSLYVYAAMVLAGVFLLIYLARASGRRNGVLTASWAEHIPFDLYLTVVVGGVACLFFLFLEAARSWQPFHPFTLLFAAAGSALCGALLLGLWMTLCLRIKLRCLWSNTLVWKLCRLLWRILKLCGRILRAVARGIASFVRRLPLVWRTALGGTVLGILLTVLADDEEWTFLLLLPLLLVAACLFAMQLRTLQKGGEALAAGDLAYQVNTKRMFWDVKRHGEALNAIGRGMSVAVEQRLRSERLKTELITNVSHDIKTPLTSIVNYVDLLQKAHTPEQERDYLAALDRQAQKLKKLTCDLVEMSKASTGNLPCHPARRSVKELFEQVMGEYAERFAEAGLTPVVTVPEQELFCMADGAQLWRVMDNLLNNVCKYAQTGTRVYLEAAVQSGFVVFSCKNISRDRLHVAAEELTERFVRGDSARSGEGSGLGLNIARSLTELQGGTLSLAIDGDLFKVTFTLPAA